jgi:hypothetical protein
MKEAEAIDWLIALLHRMDEAGGLAKEHSRERAEVLAWLYERRAAFLNIAGPYDGWC